MTTALFADTHSRDLNLSTVSATQAETGALVLRYGAEVGSLLSTDRTRHLVPSMPIIVGTEGYQAESSAGHVQVRNAHSSRPVAGIQGFPWMKRRGLRQLRQWWCVAVVPAGEIIPLVTHVDGSHHRNVATAEAAAAGLAMRARLCPSSIFIEEGQSNWTQGWEIRPGSKAAPPEFPEEHRAELFSAQAAALAMVDQRPAAELIQLLALAEWAASQPRYSGSFESEYARERAEIASYDQWQAICRGAGPLRRLLLADGWGYRLEMTDGEPMLRVNTPQQEVGYGPLNLLVGYPEAAGLLVEPWTSVQDRSALREALRVTK